MRNVSPSLLPSAVRGNRIALLACVLVSGMFLGSDNAKAVGPATWYLQSTPAQGEAPLVGPTTSIWFSSPTTGGTSPSPAIMTNTDTYDLNDFSITTLNSSSPGYTSPAGTLLFDGVGSTGTVALLDGNGTLKVGNVSVTSAGGTIRGNQGGNVSTIFTANNITMNGLFTYVASSNGNTAINTSAFAGTGDFTLYGGAGKTTSFSLGDTSAYTGKFTLGGTTGSQGAGTRIVGSSYSGVLNFGGVGSGSGSLVSATKIVTLASTSGLYAGETVQVASGSAVLPQGTTIAAILSPTQVVLSAATTGGSATFNFVDTGFITYDLSGANQTLGGIVVGASESGTVTVGATTSTYTPASQLEIRNATSGSATLTINGDSSTTNTNSTFGGLIVSDTGTVSLVKAGNKTLTLTGSNTFAGTTTIQNGALVVSTINSVSGGSTSSNLGHPTAATGSIVIGYGTTTGTLVDTGSGETTDRAIVLGGSTGGAVLDQSGTGNLKFTSGIASLVTPSATRTLTLQGSTAGTGEINGVIGNGAASVTGTSTAASTGATVLTITNALNLFTVGDTVTGSGSLQAGTVVTAVNGNSVTINKAITGAINNNTVLTFTGVASATGVTKLGSDTWSLTAANTYTGATTVNGGTLSVGGGGTTGSINSSSALSLGGGTLALTRTDGVAQTFASTTINPGGSAITAATGDTIHLNAITRQVGGTVDFSSTGTIDTTTPNTGSGAGQTILGGYATVGGSTWAVSGSGATAGVITGLATGSYTNDTWSGTSNTTVTAASNAAYNNVTTNSLRFNNAASDTVTLSGTNVITTGGVLVTSAVGANGTGITGGTLEGAAGKDLVVIQNNTSGTTTIGSVIADNGSATGLTKSGAGNLTVTGANTYTGATTINSGTVTVGVGTVAGTSGGLGVNSAVNIANNAGTGLDITGFDTQVGSLTGGGALGGNITLGANTLTTGGDNTSPAAFAGAITSTTGGSLVKIGTGTQTLSGANTYNGTTTVSAGALNIQNATGLGSTAAGTSVANGATLQLQGGVNVGAEALSIGGTGASGATGALENVSDVNTYGGLLTLTGATTISSDAGSLALTNAGTITGAGDNLTLAGAGNGSIAGIIGTTTGGLTKNGTGTWTLSGANTYTGATAINGGAVSISNLNNLGTATSAISLSGGGALAYTGTATTLSRALTLGSGGGELDSTTPGQMLTMTGSITGTGNAFTAGGSGVQTISSSIATGSGGSLTKNGTGIVSLTGSNTFTGSVTINNGILVANTVTGTNNNLGNGTSAIGLGSGTTTGLLSYDGNSTTLTRGFTIGAGGGEIDTTAPGQTLTIATGGITGTTGTLTVAGYANTAISSNITLGSGALVKTGVGTLTLSGANTFTGGTDILNGTVSVSSLSQLGSGALTYGYLSTQTFPSGVGILVYTGSGESTSRTVNLNLSGAIENDGTGGLTFTGTFNKPNANNSPVQSLYLQGTNGGLISSAIQGDTSNGQLNLVKSGTGTWSLTGSNSFQSGLIVNGGTLDLGNGGTTGTITTSNAIRFGGGTFSNSRSNSFSQSLASTTIITGDSGVKASAGDTVVLNTLSRVGVGVVDFSGTGTITTTTPFATTPNNGNQLLGAWATFNGTDWAIVSDQAGANQIQSLGNNNIGAVYSPDAWAANDDTDVTQNDSFTGETNSLRFNTAGSNTVTLSGTSFIDTGGILNTINVGNNQSTITGGTLEGAANTDLIVIQNNTSNNMTIASTIANNGGPTGLTKSGSGTLVVTGANTYTGNTAINNGTLSVSSIGTTSSTSSNLGAGAGNVLFTSGTGNATLLYTGTGETSNRAIALASPTGGGTIDQSGTGTLELTNIRNTVGSAVDGNTLSARTLTLQGSTSGVGLISGVIADAPTSVTGTYTGGVTAPAGTATFTIANAASLFQVGSVISGGNGFVAGVTVKSIVNNTVVTSATAIQGNANNTVFTFTGVATPTAVNKTGTGEWILSNANTYSGGTTVTGGTLLANNISGSATGVGALTVGANATLGGTGTSSGTGFAIQGTGTATSARANLFVGQSVSTNNADTNTTSKLTLLGTGANTIADANLVFNLNANVAGGLGGTSNGGGAGGAGVANSGNELSVGNSAIGFGTDIGSVQLTLNLQNQPAVIAAFTPYVLFAGTGVTSTALGTSTGQYAGLTLGATTSLGAGITETLISSSNMALNFTGSTDSSFYGANSYLVLYQNSNTGVDDIDVVVVPEPGTWALMLGGLALLLFIQHKKRRS